MANKENNRFRDLVIGDTFDFVDPTQPHLNSFFEPCEKISTRKYRALSNGTVYYVGTVDCAVFHVRSKGEI